jgi:hypothetical protein
MVYCDPGDDLDLFFVPAILHVPQLFVLIKPGFEWIHLWLAYHCLIPKNIHKKILYYLQIKTFCDTDKTIVGWFIVFNATFTFK